jgi:uncharacterized protein YfaS (alpha-2-macroglobulin family)
MKSRGLAVLFAATNLIAPAADTLRVMRVYPAGDADPRAAITITFDRPIVADLESALAPSRILQMEPNIAGRVEWRDPVTLRFVPAAPLVAGAEYHITLSDEFAAIDGSRLQRPHRFTVRVRPPRVLGGFPLGTGTHTLIRERPVVNLLLSDAADPERVAERTWITLARECGGRRIAMRFAGMRPPVPKDPAQLYYRYVQDYRSLGDTLRDARRLVQLIPESALPRNCGGRVSLPFPVQHAWDTMYWGFRTFGPLSAHVHPCLQPNACGSTPIQLRFSTPVRGADVLRHVRFQPALDFTVQDTAAELESWALQARPAPRQRYTVVFDAQLTDTFGQQLGTQTDISFAMGSYAPALVHPTGFLLVERNGLRTLPVRSVNVDTMLVKSIAVADTAEHAFLNPASRLDEIFHERESSSAQHHLLLRPGLDLPHTTGVRIATHNGRGSLLAMQVKRYVPPDADPHRHVPLGYRRSYGTTALVQVTDLAVHARIGTDQGLVWVTGVRNGRPRAGARVTLHDKYGTVRAAARTDAQGFALLKDFRPATPGAICRGHCASFDGYVAADWNGDRALAAISSDYQAPLAAYHFQVNTAWSTEQRIPAAVAVFTERDIYRPGERVYAKAIVREGPLGALTVPVRDSVKWEFLDHASAVIRDTVTVLSGFGTADQAMTLPAGAALGNYRLRVSLRRDGDWHALGSAYYRVAEYRAPEFLADMKMDTAARLAGDTLTAHISARYLFGAPMADAEVHWKVQQRPARPWELGIRNAEDWHIGEYASTDYYHQPAAYPVNEGIARLDARGSAALRIELPRPVNGTAAQTDVYAVVTDANRQSVTVARRVVVHAAELYLGARIAGTSWLWTAGQPETLEAIAVRPAGERVAGIAVHAAIIRRDWQSTHTGQPGVVTADTVASCSLVTRVNPVSCGFTPERAGWYVVVLTARDAHGRTARTSFERWATGPGWSWRRFSSPFRIDVTPDRPRYSVGDTATIIVASPFKGVEAWLTIERERILESRRIRLDSGTTTVRVPITDAHAPNAFVSVLLVRGRSAAPGPPDDPGRPTMRVGYAELRVASSNKRLDVQVAPLHPEYRPGDSARVRIGVKEPDGRGRRAEVTLWAVDEGVLALTGYQPPDPVELIYRPRGAGLRLASNLVAVAPQVKDGWRGRDTAAVPIPRPEWESRSLALDEVVVTGSSFAAAAAPALQGEAIEPANQLTAVLRSQFQSTAFFIGSVVTDEHGNAIASAKLPDNLTTFRIMAVAVTAGDRYGSGTSSLLVTRPLLARPSLPRFLREGDQFEAGVVVNQRTAGMQHVVVEAMASGAELLAANPRTDTLHGTAGREVRFPFRVQPGEVAQFQFAVRGRNDADAVALSVPVRPSYHPLAQTSAGVLRDSAHVEFRVDADIDPARSRLEINFGSSVLSIIRGVHHTLRVYPYACTEQVATMALPIIALYRAQKELGASAGIDRSAEDDIRAAIRTLAWRQQADGGIGYWGPHTWSTPVVTGHATRVLLEARAAGFAVDSAVFTRIGMYMRRQLRPSEWPRFAAARGYGERQWRASERLAALDVLSRLGDADAAAEEALLAQIVDLSWEDRVLLAEVLARRGASIPARQLLAQAWAGTLSEGRTITLPIGSNHYLPSNTRPSARLLSATLAIDPAHPRISPLVETLIQQGRALARYVWNTQDYAALVLALLPYERLRRQQRAAASIELRGANGLLMRRSVQAGESRDTAIALTGLVSGQSVRVSLASNNDGLPNYYYLTLREVSRTRPVKPVDNGIQLERWYERVDSRTPVTSVAAGDLVRVRLRITVPGQRHFVVVDDPLPAGLEAVDPTLRTEAPLGAFEPPAQWQDAEDEPNEPGWAFGRWYWGQWSAFDHKELRDDRVVHFATMLYKGVWTASYLARATTPGTFIMPPAHAEEMYNPAVNGRTGGGRFAVTGVRR